ncbi:hypothetical protein E4U41_000321 [Claviceps citrina]|nr:hypothetical protein E4U41_000321 [Claviceps citrina]
MTTRRPVLRALRASRAYLETRVSTRPLGSIRFSSTGPATIADTGFWTSLIPKPFRKENRSKVKGKKSQEWNPATFFVIMFLLIGSMSIQMIALRNQSERYDRQATVRLDRLREALRKLQNGEEVDVDKLLGGVDEAQGDMDWEEKKDTRNRWTEERERRHGRRRKRSLFWKQQSHMERKTQKLARIWAQTLPQPHQDRQVSATSFDILYIVFHSTYSDM